MRPIASTAVALMFYLTLLNGDIASAQSEPNPVARTAATLTNAAASRAVPPPAETDVAPAAQPAPIEPASRAALPRRLEAPAITNAAAPAVTSLVTQAIPNAATQRVTTLATQALAITTNEAVTTTATQVVAKATSATNIGAQAKNTATGAASNTSNSIPWITLNGTTYSNVVVESASGKTITFAHSRGVASVNPDKLTDAELRGLRLLEPEPPPTTNVFARLPAALGSLTNRAELEKVLDRDRLQRALSEPGGIEAYFKETGVSWKTSAGVAIGIYLFVCMLLHKICRKAGQSSPLIFIPILQIFVLYRAAKMPPIWFALLMLDIIVRLTVILFVPMEDISELPQFVVWGGIGWMILFTLIHVIAWIIWCFKICMVRSKSPALGVFLLLPCTQVFVVLYLAFSK